jgi:hypothetical protein
MTSDAVRTKRAFSSRRPCLRNAVVNRKRRYGKRTKTASATRPTARSQRWPGWSGTRLSSSMTPSEPNVAAAHIDARSRRRLHSTKATAPRVANVRMLTYRKAWIAPCSEPTPVAESAELYVRSRSATSGVTPNPPSVEVTASWAGQGEPTPLYRGRSLSLRQRGSEEAESS